MIWFLSDSIPLWVTLVWMYGAVVVSNVGAQFYQQARTLMVVSTIPESVQTQAFAYQQGAYSVISIVGPPLSAPLLFTLGAHWAVAVNALTFVIAGFLLWRVRWKSAPVEESRGQGFWAATWVGLKAVFGNPVLRTIMLAMSVVAVASAILNAMLVFFVQWSLGQPASFLGVLGMCYAGGALAGAALAPSVQKRMSATNVFVSALVLSGLLVVAFALSSNTVLAMGLLFVTGLPLGVVNVLLTPVVIAAVDRPTLGRAVAAMNFLPTAASMAGAALVGAFASSSLLDSFEFSVLGLQVGPYSALIGAAGLIMFAAAVVAAPTLLRAGAEATSAKANS